MAGSVMGQLDAVCKQHRLSLPSKLHIYRTCVLPVLLHSCETWTLLKKDQDTLQAFHTQCQHHILGVRWYDQVSNGTICEITGLGPITLAIARRCYSLFGHICHLNEHVLAHISLEFAMNLYHGYDPIQPSAILEDAQ